MDKNVLPILVSENFEVKGMTDISNIISSGTTKVVNVQTDAVKNGLLNILSSMSEVLDEAHFSNDIYEVDELEINLNIGLNGEVSIISVSENTNVSSGIKIKIQRKR